MLRVTFKFNPQRSGVSRVRPLVQLDRAQRISSMTGNHPRCICGAPTFSFTYLFLLLHPLVKLDILHFS